MQMMPQMSCRHRVAGTAAAPDSTIVVDVDMASVPVEVFCSGRNLTNFSTIYESVMELFVFRGQSSQAQDE